jgi:hypothetical protein
MSARVGSRDSVPGRGSDFSRHSVQARPRVDPASYIVILLLGFLSEHEVYHK